MKKYSFKSSSEPTVTQLKSLMLAVSVDVKKRAEEAEVKYKNLRAQSLIEARALWNQRKNRNESK
jgi:hypothetical protein